MKTNEKKDWPKRVRDLRERMGQSQDVFADTIGLKTRGAVSRLESGAYAPTDTLKRLVMMLEKNFEQNPK